MSEEQRRQLQQQLWKIADTLRGKMHADEFRDYMGFFDQKNGLSCDCVNPLGISGVQTKYRFQNWRQYC